MEIGTALAGINWLAVSAAAIAAFALGGIWYSMPVFGSAWMREIGLTKEAAGKANMTAIFATTFALQFVAATALAACMPANSNWLAGLHTGIVVGVFWIATAYAITYLFEQRSLRIFMINAGYFVVVFAVMGAIIGAG
jgi:hypothetical protein